jgi:SnoaL-like domain
MLRDTGPMAREDVEVVEAIHAEWAEGRLGREHMADGIRYVNPPDALEPGTREGADSFNSVFDVYSELRFDIERLVDAGGGRVVMVGQMEGVARVTGIELIRPHSQVWTVRDGKAVSMQWFHTEAEALDAAGIST